MGAVVGGADMTEEELRAARQKLYHAAIDLVEVFNHWDDGPEWRRAEHALLDVAAPLLKERATLAVAALGNRKGGD